MIHSAMVVSVDTCSPEVNVKDTELSNCEGQGNTTKFGKNNMKMRMMKGDLFDGVAA